MSSLADQVQATQTRAAELAGYAARAEDDAAALAARVEALERQQKLLEEVGTVLSSMEHAWRKGFEESLTSMVSRGLTLVLGEQTNFTLHSKLRGGAPSLEFVLEQGGLELDPLEAKGGTIVNLVNFLLRLAVILAAQPPMRRILVLDEAFAHVSAEYVPSLAALIRELCDTTGVQVLLVTHDPAYADAADVVYEVTQPKRGRSYYELIKSRNDDAV